MNLKFTKILVFMILISETLNICVRSIAVVQGKKEVFVAFTRTDNAIVIVFSILIIIFAYIALAEIEKAEKNARGRRQ